MLNSSTSAPSIIISNDNKGNNATGDILSVAIFVGSAMSFMVTSRLLARSRGSRHGLNHRQHVAKYLHTSSSSRSGINNNDNDEKHNLSKEDVLTLRQQHISNNVSVSYSNKGPLMIVKGKGNRLYDETGTAYLDTRNNVAHVGHSNLHVINAITKQVQSINTNTRYLHPNVSILAQRLLSLFPRPLQNGKVIFVNSGSEANDLALRISRAYNPSSKNTIVVDRACKYLMFLFFVCMCMCVCVCVCGERASS